MQVEHELGLVEIRPVKRTEVRAAANILSEAFDWEEDPLWIPPCYADGPR
jgi:hypothetical protein